mmetsp:Transcript_91366/g.175909  ORF Transcript_91366/g.175909 Transcript_91366/m.175909 type:complete len:81 (+) Transcript_91366:2124-2366(+)
MLTMMRTTIVLRIPSPICMKTRRQWRPTNSNLSIKVGMLGYPSQTYSFQHSMGACIIEWTSNSESRAVDFREVLAPWRTV